MQILHGFIRVSCSSLSGRQATGKESRTLLLKCIHYDASWGVHGIAPYPHCICNTSVLQGIKKGSSCMPHGVPLNTSFQRYMYMIPPPDIYIYIYIWTVHCMSFQF